MGRRISNGVVGSGGGLGSILVSGAGNTLTTATTNQNLILDPNGSGVTQIVTIAEVRSAGSVRFYNTGNTQYTGITSDPSSSSSYSIQLPAAAPAANNYILTATTAGVCSWSAPAVTGITVASDTSTVTAIPVLFNAAGSTVSSVGNNTNVSVIPSTGQLSSTILQSATVRGSSSVGGQLTIRGTSGTANGTAGVLMPEGIGSTSTSSGSLVITGGLGVSGRINAANFDGIVGANSAAAGTFTSLTETSSITLKENLRPLSEVANPLEAIMKMVSYIYDRKDGSAKDEAGFIAEDMNNILPNLVDYDSDGKPSGIKYTKLTPYLIEAIKSLKAEIDELKR